MGYLIKLNRISAWLLLLMVAIYFFTGFDALKNLWRPDFSRYLHSEILPLPALFLIFFHSLIGLRLFLIRNDLRGTFFSRILTAALTVVFLLFFYLFLR